MAGASTSAALIAVVSATTAGGAVPEDAAERRHHAKDGKGFINPWDSYREWSAPGIIKALLM